MKYKLVAIDMDGTLLNSHDNISERTRYAINNAIDKGIKIVLSTGRIYLSALYYRSLIDLNSPIIACNGAIVSNHKGNEILYKSHINKDILRKIIKLAEDNNVYYHFYDLSTFYCKKGNNNFAKYYEYYEENFKKQGINIIGFDNPSEIINVNSTYYKFVIIEDDIDKLQYLRGKMEQIKGISVSKSWHNNMEIMNEGVSKGKALKFLAHMLKIDNGEIIAIGDNENDVSMFKIAGLAVAMKNGDKIAKENAHIITDTNDDDGVAKVIEKYILKY
mgnify:FL=1